MFESVKKAVRYLMRWLASGLNTISGGHLSPNIVTITGLLAHLPIAWLISQQRYILAAGLLIVFGLFDTLDGELARLQKRDNPIGMLLDSSTDRMKEIFVYSGVAYAFVAASQPYMAVWAVLACGASLLVSYTNAWGEVVLSKTGYRGQVNRAFRGGIMSFEIRMVTLIAGLLSGHLVIGVALIAILGWVTAIQRLIGISNRLK